MGGSIKRDSLEDWPKDLRHPTMKVSPGQPSPHFLSRGRQAQRLFFTGADAPHPASPTLGKTVKRGARNGARHATTSAQACNGLFDSITNCRCRDWATRTRATIGNDCCTCRCLKAGERPALGAYRESATSATHVGCQGARNCIGHGGEV